jgi:putative chitinase
MIDIDKHKDILAEIRRRYNINTPMRLAHFLAQVDHESAGLTVLVENLNYTPQALLAKFSRERITQAQAMNLGRVKGRPAKQQDIANVIYGGQWGRMNLGNRQDGDGWKFRGRGPLQCTGRRNYALFGSYMGEDYTNDPDKIATIEVGMLFAGWYWTERKINQFADKDWQAKSGIILHNFDLSIGQVITRRINGGENGIKERFNLFLQYKKLLNDTSTAE